MGLHGQVALLAVVVAFVHLAMSQSLPNCPDRCGDVAISYPFGVGDQCSLEIQFNITCKKTEGPTPKYTTYLENSTIEITEIMIDSGELRILRLFAKDCYTKAGQPDSNRSVHFSSGLRLRPTMAVSQSRNKFFAVGCDTYALVNGTSQIIGEDYTTGCMSLCNSERSIVDSCTGAGCCEIPIPAEFRTQMVRVSSYDNHTAVWAFNPCSYAFMVEIGKFKFSGVSSFQELDTMKTFPTIVNWSVGDLRCEQAKSAPGYACKGNAKCIDSKLKAGYLCNCLPGYHGNPYHPDGCQDTDECQIEKYCNGTCINTAGSYRCTCDKGFTLTNGTTCIKDVKIHSGQHRATLIYTLSGVSAGFVALVCVGLMLYLVHNKRKFLKKREKFFELNGGQLLERSLESNHDQPTKIFTEEELKKATNNYTHILGEGGYGIVYKGILPDKRVVAIKKPKLGVNTQTKEQTQQFINEVILLMQINHRNVVRLLGCCLETEVPILVYEFITNGTLFELIHERGLLSEQKQSLSWGLRLKIATETAGALAYLHSGINMPILHRDIKSMNILLDENYSAKVSDFGTSRLVPLDQEALSTLVQGTIGYLDPEYLQTSQLTDKSDVYSFGVVLAELLTGRKALSFDKAEGVTINLAMSFLLLKDDEQLRRVVDKEIDYESNVDAFREVVNLAKRCLRIIGEERPTMKEVAMELEGLRAISKHPWGEPGQFGAEENENLVFPSNNIYGYNYDIETGSSVNVSAVYDSIQEQSMLRAYNDGR